MIFQTTVNPNTIINGTIIESRADMTLTQDLFSEDPISSLEARQTIRTTAIRAPPMPAAIGMLNARPPEPAAAIDMMLPTVIILSAP
jgi:hypothetical protein